mmetsp:Transcript_27890/g.64811  ORF Transcript_27890/g.64811 Transcript_27890/m.64811 type:complete len:506 (-) Transcript_27890:94-1611(-)
MEVDARSVPRNIKLLHRLDLYIALFEVFLDILVRCRLVNAAHANGERSILGEVFRERGVPLNHFDTRALCEPLPHFLGLGPQQIPILLPELPGVVSHEFSGLVLHDHPPRLIVLHEKRPVQVDSSRRGKVVPLDKVALWLRELDYTTGVLIASRRLVEVLRHLEEEMWTARISMAVLLQLNESADRRVLQLSTRIVRQLREEAARPRLAEKVPHLAVEHPPASVVDVTIGASQDISLEEGPMSLLLLRAPNIEDLDLLLVPVDVNRHDHCAAGENGLRADAVGFHEPLWLHPGDAVEVGLPDGGIVGLLNAREDLDLALAVELEISQGIEDLALRLVDGWDDHYFGPHLRDMVCGVRVRALLQLLDRRLHRRIHRPDLLVPPHHWRGPIRLMRHAHQPPEVTLHVLHKKGNLLQKESNRDFLEHGLLRHLDHLGWGGRWLDLFSDLRHGRRVELRSIGIQTIAPLLGLEQLVLVGLHLRVHATHLLIGQLLHHSHLHLLLHHLLR